MLHWTRGRAFITSLDYAFYGTLESFFPLFWFRLADMRATIAPAMDKQRYIRCVRMCVSVYPIRDKKAEYTPVCICDIVVLFYFSQWTLFVHPLRCYICHDLSSSRALCALSTVDSNTFSYYWHKGIYVCLLTKISVQRIKEKERKNTMFPNNF